MMEHGMFALPAETTDQSTPQHQRNRNPHKTPPGKSTEKQQQGEGPMVSVVAWIRPKD
jgi:hypothetical protein